MQTCIHALHEDPLLQGAVRIVRTHASDGLGDLEQTALILASSIAPLNAYQLELIKAGRRVGE